MRLKNMKVIIAAAYVVMVVVAGLVSGVTSPSGWTVLTALALLPAGAMLTLWHDPAQQTMSESIQQARR
jgi:hypothetical protein